MAEVAMESVSEEGQLKDGKLTIFAGRRRFCKRRFAGGDCPCCEPSPKDLARTADVLNGKRRRGNWLNGQGAGAEAEGGRPTAKRQPRPPAAARPGPLGATPPKATAPFVDTHCHLEEVLQMVQRHNAVSSLNKEMCEFTPEELAHWRILGWLKDPEAEKPSVDKGSAAAPWNPIWERVWPELEPAQREAATKLGYAADSWNRNQWLLPKNVGWSELSERVQQCLEALGESPNSWDSWTTGTSSGSTVVNCNDLRPWSWLSPQECASARSLGFTQATWNSVEMADVHDTVGNIFGESFEGCVTQGCDADSIDTAMELALKHPKVYVSFGCHPKAAWSYDDKMEQRLLACMKACGRKAVAWGEFGLDYSHVYFGRMADNRRAQKVVFARQLKLAIGNGYPLVIHSRAADRDTLRMMRGWVPRHWKVHVHSFRGSMAFMEAILSEWEHAYIGLAGIITMPDPEAQELCRCCPLSRMVLETDAPYLPVQSTYFSHPGQIPEIIEKVAKIKGCAVDLVATAVRENARTVYGF